MDQTAEARLLAMQDWLLTKDFYGNPCNQQLYVAR
jgi:hypothetical protein